MKKNMFMRLAMALVLLVLVTTSAVGGTYAKYTTAADAGDTARVAKWGVTVAAAGDEAFGEKYNNNIEVAGTKVVSSVEGEKVLAPGTTDSLGGLTITGTPEVMVDYSATLELTLAGWTTDGTDDYCPLVFYVTVNSVLTEYYIGKSGITTAAELASAVENAVNKVGTNVAANTNLEYSVSIVWAWEFDSQVSGAKLPSYQSDVKDTALGNRAYAGNAATITAAWNVSVTQVD